MPGGEGGTETADVTEVVISGPGDLLMWKLKK